MRSTLLLSVTLAPLLLQPLVAFAQTENSTYLQGLATALQGLGFTQLANAAVAANDTAEGQALLADLSQTNRNFTIFAPSDAACEFNSYSYLSYTQGRWLHSFWLSRVSAQCTRHSLCKVHVVGRHLSINCFIPAFQPPIVLSFHVFETI